jgi:hydrogenase/urease accessory protein HupE
MSARTAERLLLWAIAMLLVASVILAIGAPNFFVQVFAAEDGPVETATALFLLVAGLMLAWRIRGLSGLGAALTGVYALLFLFAAGEEISWGQRIFGWNSNDFFATHNAQGETNLHNLTVGGHRLARTLFGSGLTAVVLFYLVVFPILYSRIGWIRRIAARLAIPVPGLRHAGLAVAASVIAAGIGVPRKWEVYELVFALLATAIFIRPGNHSGQRRQI